MPRSWEKQTNRLSVKHMHYTKHHLSLSAFCIPSVSTLPMLELQVHKKYGSESQQKDIFSLFSCVVQEQEQ